MTEFLITSVEAVRSMQVDKHTQLWSTRKFGGCALGDIRRTRRLVQLASHVGTAPLRACCGDAAASKGAYRLLRNEAVAAEAIAAGGFAATAVLAGCTGGLAGGGGQHDADVRP